MSFPKRPLELYTRSAQEVLSPPEWSSIISSQYCQYLDAKCTKIRKSQPDITIGTCTVGYQGNPVIICPHRFLQRRQIFMDTLHLLKEHVPGNQLHVVPEISIPGGNIDYFVVSVQRGEVADYVALEIQALDTTGTVWPARQTFINEVLNSSDTAQSENVPQGKSYGMNWKMTAKTILVQLHHKVETLELLGKKMVLVIQNVFYHYVTQNFSTSHLREASSDDSTHFHVYTLEQDSSGLFSLELATRQSTTAKGVEQMLGLRHDSKVSEEELKEKILAKISEKTLLAI